MNYQETVQYIFKKTTSFQRIGQSAYKEDLANIKALCAFLNHPEKAFKTIHIGGTNGKGSTASILTSVFMENQRKVGKFTSPHYLDFRERIQVDGKFITEQAVVDFIEKTQSIIEEIQPSFFEITTAMAFWYFHSQKVEIAVIEVGLGGRLDSTNIISPLLSIITNISIDHQAILGNTIEEIAKEKAGIIKPNTPVIIGKTQEESRPIFIKKAKENNSNIYFADQDLNILSSKVDIKQGFHQIQLESICNRKEIHLMTNLFGDYQQKNIRTAYKAFQVLKPILNLTTSSFQKGLSNIENNTFLIGRFQVIEKKPLTIADSCHNQAGVETFLAQLKSIPYRHLYIIYGCVSDKDASEIINLFPKDAKLILTEPSIPRKMEISRLEKFAKECFTEYDTKRDVKAAFHHCKRIANQDDIILIFGSIFLVADLLKS